ncbi:xanthine dehydrogenase accessory protein XdhC [Rhodobacteraceae bacterium DSL-40]|uniref:xanthine dehydrogenase accessory protein XdhC n=1 Tax=Amaricoccus sp. B4 TaxID=3368557 RepID=UPI000DAC32DD
MVSEGFDLGAITAAVARQGAVVRIVVAAFRGSAPRETGAAMLVSRAGQSGTIGGGALEFEAARHARALLDAPPERWARALLQMPLGPALGQCCGGAVTLLLERFGPEEVAALEQETTPVFARPVASGTAPEAVLGARRQRRSARSGEGGQSGLSDGLMVERFAEPVQPVWLYGAGHVGRAIVRVVEDLPLAVTWVDTARARFPEAIPAHVTMLVAADPARAALHATDDAMHLVLTYSHALDLEICHTVLGRPFRHLGLIGSASKRARFLSRLAALGHPEAALARLSCPIGDRSLGKRPAAIALGVVAELVRRAEAGTEQEMLSA